jgi:hypothetical protein
MLPSETIAPKTVRLARLTLAPETVRFHRDSSPRSWLIQALADEIRGDVHTTMASEQPMHFEWVDPSDTETVKKIAEMYSKVTVDLKDHESLMRFTKKGGIFKPLSEEAIGELLQHPNYKILTVKNTDGETEIMVSLLLPPDESVQNDKIFHDTIFENDYRKRLDPRLAAGMEKSVGKIGWIHDMIANTSIKTTSGVTLIKEVKKFFKEKGLKNMATEIWNIVSINEQTGSPTGFFNQTSARIAQHTGGNPVAAIVDSEESLLRHTQRQLYIWPLEENS